MIVLHESTPLPHARRKSRLLSFRKEAAGIAEYFRLDDDDRRATRERLLGRPCDLMGKKVEQVSPVGVFCEWRGESFKHLFIHLSNHRRLRNIPLWTRNHGRPAFLQCPINIAA